MELFDIVLIDPMTNALIVLSNILFGDFGLAIIVFTIIIRAVTFPLTLRQLHASRAMAALQPRLQEVQKKHKDPKRRSEETMKLYREAGVNPAGCLLPMLIQFPIWIALYTTIRITLSSTPESLIGLSQRLYPWSYIRQAMPLENHFLWMDLAQPDTILPFLVGASTWVQQRMMTPPSTDARTQQTNQMMLWMMPLMFAWFTLTVPSGLGVYWTATNLVGIALQFFYMRQAGRSWRQVFMPAPAPAGGIAPAERRPAPVEEEPAVVTADISRSRRRRSHGRRRRKR